MRSPDSRADQDGQRSDRRRLGRRAPTVLAAVVALLAVPTTLALARTRATRVTATPAVVDATHNAALDATVVVDEHGRTLYALSGETARHLKCTSAECLKFWPPLTVASARAVLREGAGVHGKLGEFRRADGVEQVTLRGLPLYRFSLDKAPGSAAGQSVSSFGGVWHAVTAGATGAGVVTSTPVTSTTTTATGGAPGAPDAPGVPGAPAGSTSATTTSSSVGYVPTSATSVSSAVTTTATTTSAPTSSSTVTMSSTSSACTPYYIGSYYYPCP